MEFLQFFSPLLLDVHHVFGYGKVFKSLCNKTTVLAFIFLIFGKFRNLAIKFTEKCILGHYDFVAYFQYQNLR